MVRQCFLTKELIFFAEERAKRPQNFKSPNALETPSKICPFCLENYSMTPTPVFETDDKKIRIVPNKYPFVSINDQNHYGIHDVVIDTANHSERLYQFSDEHMDKVIKALKYRVSVLQKDDKIVYVQIFKNDGIDAGASQSHSHWQIASLSVFPPKYREINNVLNSYYIEKGECYFCHIRDTLKEQLIDENSIFIAYVPIDARFPYEMHIIPKKHIYNIEQLNNEETYFLGNIIKNCAKRLASLYERISYNICFFNSPKPSLQKSLNSDFTKYFHLNIQIFPRMGRLAGFEFSTGCYINSVLPEISAEILKNININQE